ncbi:MAG: WG repeat-containing protein [Bacillus subtilis]|nr:WG repeat-containing protein [Bacillus subtilis]
MMARMLACLFLVLAVIALIAPLWIGHRSRQKRPMLPTTAAKAKLSAASRNGQVREKPGAGYADKRPPSSSASSAPSDLVPLLPIAKDGLFGFTDPFGRVVIEPPVFHGLPFFGRNEHRVVFGGKTGFIGRDGKMIVAPQYDNAGDMKENRAHVQLGWKCGYIDREGKTVIPMKFDDAADYRQGLAKIRIGSKYGFIDRNGSFVVEPQLDDAFGVL